MAAWLAAVTAALDLAPAPCPIFFRDDDAGWDDDTLFALLSVFDRRRVPVDVALIPAALTPRLASELAARAADGGVRIHQHGYAHTNHEPAGRKCEFGPARTAAEHAQDIATGRTRLVDAFGGLVDPVFTPPWNRCTDDTAAALVNHGFKVLSRDASAQPIDRGGLAEVPVTVDWFGGRKGVRWTRDELSTRLADGIRSGGPVGVMLHHALVTDTERAAVDELLAAVATHPRAALSTIAEVAR